MGVGFAIFMPEESVGLAQKIAKESYGFNAGRAGYVESGPKQVVIRPKGITFQADSLGVR
jgi:phosphoribosylformylglycinamidine cyclo-ligase